MGVSLGAFWMRIAFRAVPKSIADAAAIDGANSRTQLLNVHLPLARPAIFTLVLLSFTWILNDYFLALILVSDPAHQPLTLGLGAFSRSTSCWRRRSSSRCQWSRCAWHSNGSSSGACSPAR
jgi:raffinose/stachyose/melibiose transport system permease protein